MSAPSLATVVRDWARHPAFHARQTLIRTPAIYLPLARRKHGDHARQLRKAVFDHTDVVIEGYPRSANTFAVEAFRLAQPERCTIAHHLHAPAQALYAVRRGIPAVTLIRAPRDAVVSYAVLLRGRVSVEMLTWAYVRYYEPLEPIRDRHVVAGFEVATADFGRVIDALNERYGTSFARFESTPETLERCFAEVRRANEMSGGGSAGLAMPSDDRKAAKERFARAYDALDEGLRARAERAYRRFAEVAVPLGAGAAVGAAG